jgi:cobalamin biosynthesis protein CobD/CbiB
LKASVPRRIAIIEQYAYENLMPVSQVLALLEDMLTLFRSWEATPSIAELIRRVEYVADPLRKGDLETVHRRLQEYAHVEY